MQWIRQRGKIRFYKKSFIPNFIPNLSALFGLGIKSRIIKNVIAVDVSGSQ